MGQCSIITAQRDQTEEKKHLVAIAVYNDGVKIRGMVGFLSLLLSTSLQVLGIVSVSLEG